MQRPRWQRPTWLKTTIVVLGVGAIGLSVVAVAIVVPRWQTAALRKGVADYQKASPKPTKEERETLKELAALEKAQLDTENALRTSLIQGLGGTVLLVGLFFTYRNLKVAEDKLVTDRFSKAVEMFSNKDLHTRLGGLYALERIANDSDKDYPQVMEVLCAFVRAESPYPLPPQDATRSGTAEPERAPTPVVAPDLVAVPEPAAESESSQSAEPLPGTFEWLAQQQQQEHETFFAALPTLRTDIQAVMTVLGRRKHRYGKGEWETQELDLRKTDLRQLQAQEANLTGVNLFGAHLEGADLAGADLKDAWLTETHLEGASLSGAHLEGADLSRAHLERAWLTKTHLEGAWLTGAHLEGADLSRAHLKDASLSGAHLKGASLTGAHLEGAYLSQAHLKDAILSGAHLKGAILSGTDLSQVLLLTQKQLDSARTSELTKLPPGLQLPDNHIRFPTAPSTTTTAAPEPSPTAPSTSSPESPSTSPESSPESTPAPSAAPLTALTPATQTEPKAESEGTSS